MFCVIEEHCFVPVPVPCAAGDEEEAVVFVEVSHGAFAEGVSDASEDMDWWGNAFCLVHRWDVHVLLLCDCVGRWAFEALQYLCQVDRGVLRL